MLKRSVKPILSFRNTGWPWSKTLADAQNRTQRMMLAHFVRVERRTEEDDATFHRRRMRVIAGLAREQGLWGRAHAERVVAWSKHLRRPRNGHSLAAKLYCWHDANWLQARRRDNDIGGVDRPGTRLSSGPVPIRWDESVNRASEALNTGN